uniref:stannin n=1 Tax=Myxine glutinosa TaxID=7769 RepID=UPI00358EBC04
MTTLDHSPTTGIVTVIVIMMAVAALGTLLLGCWCCLRIWQGTPTPEDEESIVGDGVRKDPFLVPGPINVQTSPHTNPKAVLIGNGPQS